MESLNTYFGMANNDYLFAKAGMQTGDKLGNYNVVASLCSQACGKYMKAVLELCFSDREELLKLLHSHNLRSLYNVIITKYELSISSKDCKWVGDFYFDARYPGDDFICVNNDDAEECLRITEQLCKDAKEILESEMNARMKKKEKLKSLSAFNDD